MNKISIAILLFTFLTIFYNCTPLKRIKYLQNFEGEDKVLFHNKVKVYTIKPGDLLFIRVFGLDDKTDKFFNLSFHENISNFSSLLYSYPVNDSGYIYYPVIGKIKVSGMTIEQITNHINKEIKNYITEATVFVKLVNFKVSVLGEVTRPGYYAISDPYINIFEVIAQAGEITTNGNRKKVHLIRTDEKGKIEVKYLDLTQRNILENEYFYLCPGDIIYVEPLRAKQFATNPMPIGTIISIITSVISTTVLILKFFN